MPLFQETIVRKYLKNQEKAQIAEKWAIFRKHFHNPTVQENIRNSKEEQYQGEFLIDLFVKVLGYTKNPTPDYNLTTELKNVKDSKKADGAMIFDNKVMAIIELKGTNTTDLNRIESQAFGYKNNQTDCVYVITSNFEKLRFYIDNAIENIEFNLFRLTEKEFELLYLCLSFESLKNGIPKQLKQESLNQEDAITKKLYQDYSNFKNDLYQNLLKNNPEFAPLELFKKSQKLLDRFLFLFFAEDKLLVQPNSVRIVLKRWTENKKWDDYLPLYEQYKKYFNFFNKGSQALDIYPYNGGLFLADEILDQLRIDDHILHDHTLRMSDYDFNSEVDVNILGHIFENSLNEIEEIAKGIVSGEDTAKGKVVRADTNNGENLPAVVRVLTDDKIDKVSKRKKDGVFYTPKYITKYIVQNTVGKLCHAKKAEWQILDNEYIADKKRTKGITQNLLDRLKTYRNWLLQIKIIDPACGSGAFLNEALNFLIAEHAYIDELQAKLFGDSLILSDVEKSILENNLFGVDINEESVDIAKLSLWLRTARPERKLNNLNANIKCGNSLISDPQIAGNQAFDWHKEFPQVFQPSPKSSTVGEVSHSTIAEGTSATGKALADSSQVFQPLQFQPSPKSSTVGEVSHSTIAEGTSATGKALADSSKGFDVVIGNPPYVQINDNIYTGFETQKCGDLYALFFERGLQILKNKGIFGYITPSLFIKGMRYESLRNFLINNTNIIEITDQGDKVFAEVQMPTAITILTKEKIENQNWEQFSPDNALVSKINQNSIFLQDISNIMRGLEIGKDKVYDFKGNIQFLTGEDIFRYGINNFSSISTKIFNEFKKDNAFFKGKRVLIRETGSRLTSIYLEDEITHQNRSLYSIKIIDESLFDPLYILAILNSQVIQFYYQSKFAANTDIFPKIRIGQVKQLPIKKIPFSDQQPFIEKADLMIDLNKKLQNILQKFQGNLRREFSLEKLNTKLENWYELDFADFLKELEKQKIKLKLSQKSEWEEYFATEQKKATEISAQIQQTDREIDEMVFDLYGLSAEEREMIVI